MKPAAPRQLTLNTIFDRYIELRETKVRHADGLRWALAVPRTELGNLHPDHMSNRMAEEYAKNRGAADGTILKELRTVRAAINLAYKEGWIANPSRFSMPVSDPPPRDRWLTREEARALLDSADTPHIYLFIVLALTTAARSGAILELKWSQVDLKNKRIDYGQGHGNKRRSVVPINQMALGPLLRAEEAATSEYVIEWAGKPVKAIKTAFNKTVERAKLKDVSPHILRHTAATWMAIDGKPMREIAKVLGDSEDTVERHYAKYHPDYLKYAVSALSF